MKLYQRFASLIALLFLSNTLAADTWNSYFPTNKPIKAKIMELASAKELQQIAEKMRDGIKTHQEWFMTYVKNFKTIKPGEKLPYHPNFGITETEYNILFSGVKSLKMLQTGSTEVRFIKDKNETIKIQTNPKSPIDGIKITANAVDTPYGQLRKISQINNINKDTPTGSWQGIQWSLSELKLQELSGKEVKLAAGKLKNTGEGILYYDVKNINKSENKSVQFSYIVYYPLT